MDKQKNKLQNFTNLYELSKTLRFELKPVGETLAKIKEHFQYDKDLQTFLKDQKIEDAYQLLKPKIDTIHEFFIDTSLESAKAKQIDFSEYLEKYKKKDALLDTEKKLRNAIGKTYLEGGKKLKYEYLDLKWKKGSSETRGVNMLFSIDILEAVRQDFSDDEDVENALEEFKSFFTYLSGFNQNRANYYTTDGKVTAIATRIVDENLPKFCANTLQFNGYTKKNKKGKEIKFDRKNEYLEIYTYLKAQNKTTQIKDADTDTMIEATPITEEIFQIAYFVNCFSQKEIEEYNKKIGHCNQLINLYNQAKNKEENFKKLPLFNTLYKQIGCGKREPLFFSITHDTKKQSKENKEKFSKPYSVEEILEDAKDGGEKFFKEPSNNEDMTVYTLTKWLRNNKDWEGVYWSKPAINTISNKYFANWHEIKDKLKKDKTVASFNKKREEQIKINDAVELAGLFEVLDDFGDEGMQPGRSEKFFKPSIIQDRKDEIDESKTLSQNLLSMLCNDIENNAKDFTDTEKQAKIFSISDYKEDKNKKFIKEWMDGALAVNKMIKYFRVKANKIKGSEINTELNNILDILLDKEKADWFKCYDSLRNYLTKKPQDDVKENKLKLNFEKGNLLNGFVDSHSASDNATQYGGYLFRKYIGNDELEYKKYYYYLGISKDPKLFRCHLQNEIRENDKNELQRLEYYQPKSTTFFSDKYSENKKKIVEYLSAELNVQIEKEKELLDIENDNKKIGELDRLKTKLLKGDTPTKLFDNIQKNKKYIYILEDKKLNELVDETIKEMKIFIKNYEERTSKLKEIQERKYIGWKDLKCIIDDLQEIAKKQKVYNFFAISNSEFQEVKNRKDKPLFLFQIVNKDLQRPLILKDKKTGRSVINNLHTIYFETLLSGNQDAIDIGAGAIFYRQYAIDKKVLKDGYEKKPWIIKNKRFTKNESLTEDKKMLSQDGKSFFLHLSISLNFSSDPSTIRGKRNKKVVATLNTLTQTEFIKQENIYFLGLDRGEKHLVYYCLIDQKGKIIKQGDLDMPFLDANKNPRSVLRKKYFYDKKTKEWEEKEVDCWNYNDLLDAVSSNRDMARKNWQTIGNIKNLKAGYISQIVYEIVKEVTNKPTYIVLEDLNTGFKRGRQKIEKQIYQKFEVALAKKLNFIVDKTAQDGELASVTKALQLTPPVENYQDIEKKKQVGVMLYTRANYTSVTDPKTGWRKTVYLKKGSEESIKEQILEKFTDIGFDGKDYFFEYEDDFTGKKWRIWSGKDGKALLRYRGKRGKDKYEWIIEEQDIVEILDGVFQKFDKNRSLYGQIKEGIKLIKYNEHTAWESLRFAIDLIQQIRNSGDVEKKEDDNFLLSPVKDENGKHFDSREYENQENADMPRDADANGAFNIARKGLIMHEHIKQWKKDGARNKDLNLFISDREWDLWLLNREEWRNKLSTFASQKLWDDFATKK